MRLVLTWLPRQHTPLASFFGGPSCFSQTSQGVSLWFGARAPLLFSLRVKGLFFNCQLCADGSQVFNSSLNLGLRLSYPTAYCTSPHGCPSGDTNLISWSLVSFFSQPPPPPTSRSSFISVSSEFHHQLPLAAQKPGWHSGALPQLHLASKQFTWLSFFCLCDTHGAAHFSPAYCLISNSRPL